MNTTTATANITAENTQASTTATNTGNWMITVAGLLFWATVILQFLLVNSDIIDQAFADHIIYNIFPLTGAFAFFGIKKEQDKIAKLLSEKNSNANS